MCNFVGSDLKLLYHVITLLNHIIIYVNLINVIISNMFLESIRLKNA